MEWPKRKQEVPVEFIFDLDGFNEVVDRASTLVGELNEVLDRAEAIESSIKKTQKDLDRTIHALNVAKNRPTRK